MARVRAVHLGLIIAVGVTAMAPALAADPTTQDLDQRVRKLENIVQSGQIARLLQQVNSLESELRELRGQIQEQGHRMDQLRERQRNLYSDIDRRIRELEVARKADRESDQGSDAAAGGETAGGQSNADSGRVSDTDASSDDRAADGQGDAGGGGEASGSSDRKAYHAAYELLKQGRYGESATALAEFVEKHPDSAYADNAQYWLGESRYVTGDFEDALKAFRKVSEAYPESSKGPDARLKVGYTLYELERYDEAESELRKVKQDNAGSTVARLAEERLLKIKRRQSDDGQ